VPQCLYRGKDGIDSIEDLERHRLGRTAPLEHLNKILDIRTVNFDASREAVEKLLRGAKEQNATGVGRFEARYKRSASAIR
jgi:hypothetical protein